MLQMLVVTLREGIEAFLIVAIAIAYLRKTGRDGLVPAAWWGTGIAVTLSVVLGGRIETAAQAPGAGPWIGVFLLVLLMITREGMEMAFITASLARQAESVHMLWGALIGIGLAGLLAWGWSRFGHRVNLGLFFQVTSIFLVLFALQLLIYSFHEATEANVLPIDNPYWHIATEPYGPEGQYGAILTYALVLVPGLWIAWAAFGRKRRAGPAVSAKS